MKHIITAVLAFWMLTGCQSLNWRTEHKKSEPFARQVASRNSQVRYLDVQPTKTINCRATITPEAGSSLVDCRHKTHYGYVGQEGYVYNDVELNSLVVDVYEAQGHIHFTHKGQLFLHNPPETFRHYIAMTENSNCMEDPWIRNHKKVTKLLQFIKNPYIEIKYFGFPVTTDVYTDKTLRSKKPGSLGSQVEVAEDAERVPAND